MIALSLGSVLLIGTLMEPFDKVAIGKMSCIGAEAGNHAKAKKSAWVEMIEQIPMVKMKTQMASIYIPQSQ